MLENTDATTRRAERKAARKAVVLLVESAEQATSHDATTVDISQYGLKIEAQVPLIPGQVLHLVQPEDPDDPLRYLVVWSADISSDGKSEAGLEFLDQTYTSTEC